MRFLLFIYTIVMTLCFLVALTKTAKANEVVTQLIVSEARKQGVNPNLALAVAIVESNLNQEARGSANEIGIYQLHPKYHVNTPAIHTPNGNVAAGISYLRRVLAICTPKYGDAAFVCFNSGPYQRLPYKDVRATDYYKKVTAELQKLRGTHV